VITTYRAAPDIDVLTSSFPIPGLGSVPINAFVLHGDQPVLVDTGAVVERDEFLDVLRTVIDVADLRWIWLTHTDADHIGALHALLDENTDLKVVTTFLGVGAMSLADPLPLDRVHLVNPGQRLEAGGRTLTALRPPTFDNPCTTGFHDGRSGALFSADSFGALLADVPQRAEDLTEAELQEGQALWATLDSPWLHSVDADAFASQLDGIHRLGPSMILSSHLPAASAGLTERLLATLAAVPAAPPFAGPDQAALEVLLAGMTSGAPG
jgi:flavorubredoxin